MQMDMIAPKFITIRSNPALWYMGRGYRRPAQEAFVVVGFNLGLIVTWITQIKFREKQIHPPGSTY